MWIVAAIFFFLLFFLETLAVLRVSVRSVVWSSFKCKPHFFAKHLLIHVDTFHPPLLIPSMLPKRNIWGELPHGGKTGFFAVSVLICRVVWASARPAVAGLFRCSTLPPWRIARLSVGVENWQLCLGSATAGAINGDISISRASCNKAVLPLEIYNLTSRLPTPLPSVSFCLVAKRLVNPINLPDHQKHLFSPLHPHDTSVSPCGLPCFWAASFR